MIHLIDVAHEYRFGAEPVHALKRIDLRTGPGEFVAVAGPSGSGKTTLFYIIGAMLRPTRGSVRVAGHDLHALPEAQRANLRNREIGFVFQFFNLLPECTAVENVELPLAIAGVRPAERRDRALTALDRVGLTHRAAHRPDQLSGGEMQRVSIARAVVHRPRLILADEPTGNLDRAASNVVIDLLASLHEADEITVLVTTHDEIVMERFARVVTLDKGEIVDETR